MGSNNLNWHPFPSMTNWWWSTTDFMEGKRQPCEQVLSKAVHSWSQYGPPRLVQVTSRSQPPRKNIRKCNPVIQARTATSQHLCKHNGANAWYWGLPQHFNTCWNEDHTSPADRMPFTLPQNSVRPNTDPVGYVLHSGIQWPISRRIKHHWPRCVGCMHDKDREEQQEGNRGRKAKRKTKWRRETNGNGMVIFELLTGAQPTNSNNIYIMDIDTSQ